MASQRNRPAPKTTKDLRIKDTDTMMRAIEDQAARLSDWEKGFFASVTDRFYIDGKELTTGQYICLEKIYDRLYSGCKI